MYSQADLTAARRQGYHLGLDAATVIVKNIKMVDGPKWYHRIVYVFVILFVPNVMAEAMVGGFSQQCQEQFEALKEEL